MLWKMPPRIKVFEALGAIADNRIVVSGNTAKVKSSSGGKYYDVAFDESAQTIGANDNGSYWQGYLGYPAIAYLMLRQLLPFDKSLSEKLKKIHWKEINQKYKNDFSKTEEHLFTLAPKTELLAFSEKVIEEIKNLHLHKPPTRQKPPMGW